MSGVLVDLGAPPVAAVAVVGVPVQNPVPPPGQGEEFGKASPIALVVIVALGVATVLLIRSMSKHLRRLPASFDAKPSRGDVPAVAEPARADPVDAEPVRTESEPDHRA